MKAFLFYIAQNYSFEILRPLQHEALSQGHQCAWFVQGNAVDTSLFDSDEVVLQSIEEVIAYRPDAVFVPGNLVPNFIPGLKVQLFHGFEWKKKGHFRIRGFFDLYCTQGPLFTEKFLALKNQHNHFNVIETGWPKTDPLFQAKPYAWEGQQNKKTILYAPTFSPALTSAPALFDEIKRLAHQGKWQWLIKFHPKMPPEWIKKFQALSGENLHVVKSETLAPVLQAADVLVSDTSSIITEFALLSRPIVTFNNLAPEPHLINITEPAELATSIETALSLPEHLLEEIERNVALMHPYRDGGSSKRVLDATMNMLEHGRKELKDKPWNLFRTFKLRKKMGYWRF